MPYRERQNHLLKALLDPTGGVVSSTRWRALRQIVVLEFELRGLLEAPDRDTPRKLRLVKSDRPGFEPPDMEELMSDLEEPGDLESLDLFDIRLNYRRGPIDQVVSPASARRWAPSRPKTIRSRPRRSG